MAEGAASRRRVVLITLDGVGIGALPDAQAYGDDDAHTLRHVAAACGGLRVPNLQRLGLGNIEPLPGVPPVAAPQACHGKMEEISVGKDTTTGHWELAGLPTLEPFATFPHGFPDAIIDRFTDAVGVPPLGNCAASGTEILRQLGEEHCRSGRPIVYTSSDSVFQVAAHEEIIPVERLYAICRIAREILDPFRVARVIARPFVGSCRDDFRRTSRRHDFSVLPPASTLLDLLAGTGYAVHGIGKIYDIFCGRGITSHVTTVNDADGMQQTLKSLGAIDRGLIFTNLVDFDMLYGHRLDAAGFAANLELFDAWLPELLAALREDDLLVITADHGCDPTTEGTDHTREYVPVLVWHPRLVAGVPLGVRTSFCDVAATAAEWLGVVQEFGREMLVGNG